MSKFNVGDTVKVTKWQPNNTRLYTGTILRVEDVDTSGRYEWYTVRPTSTRGLPYGHGTSSLYKITGGNLALESATPNPGKPTVHPVYTTDEANALASKVVEVARKAAKKHSWCAVVDEVLKEAGLGAYMNTVKKVRLVTEVTVNSKPGENLTDEQAIALAKSKAASGQVTSTSVIR